MLHCLIWSSIMMYFPFLTRQKATKGRARARRAVRRHGHFHRIWLWRLGQWWLRLIVVHFSGWCAQGAVQRRPRAGPRHGLAEAIRNGRRAASVGLLAWQAEKQIRLPQPRRLTGQLPSDLQCPKDVLSHYWASLVRNVHCLDDYAFFHRTRLRRRQLEGQTASSARPKVLWQDLHLCFHLWNDSQMDGIRLQEIFYECLVLAWFCHCLGKYENFNLKLLYHDLFLTQLINELFSLFVENSNCI